MDGTAIIFICFAVFCLCMALYKLLSKGEQKQIQQAQSQFSPEQLKFLQTVGSLFKENKSMLLLQIYEECGISHDIAYSRNSSLIDEHTPFEVGTEADNVFKTYAYAVNKRDMLKNNPLMEHPNDVLNLNLHPKEKIYHVIYGVVFYQEKTTVTNVVYSGVKWTSGPLHSGTMSVITNEYTHFTPADAGHLIFTNERLIFLGKQKNVTKQVKLSEILYNNMYQDGVMVHIPNRKPWLFKFPDNKDFEIFEISDGINEFAIVFDRIKNGNYLENLAAPQKFVNPESHVSLVEALKSKNFDPLVAEVISMAKVGEPAMVSAIQRRFEIGYNKAGKIMDQMECLMFVSPYENGKREWMIDASDTKTIERLIEAVKPIPSCE